MSMAPGPILTPSMLPAEDDFACTDSSFFQRPSASLPTPSDVRAASGQTVSLSRPELGPFNAVFRDLNLFVKFGGTTVLSEAKTLWAIRRIFGDQVPVPEVYGWCQDNGQVFIYMELVDGLTLKERWPSLSQEDQKAICNEIAGIVHSLGTLEQPPDDRFIGSITRQGLTDMTFYHIFTTTGERPGPFTSLAAFHDYFARVDSQPDDTSEMCRADIRNELSGELTYADLEPKSTRVLLMGRADMREMLKGNLSVKFTHGDLYPENIMVSSNDPPRVIAIIDWGQAGWLPEPWEYCKACGMIDREKLPELYETFSTPLEEKKQFKIYSFGFEGIVSSCCYL
ncbi:kinase-like domain-containing protein [Phlebopus sp. FC_14]|nr:kinase-like domain-containing protein [Phlebopus sp. FC_14]